MNHFKFVQLLSIFLASILCCGARPAVASFHFMQIEQVIGGVNGDTTAQAIQLRMRSSNQHLVQQSKIMTRDATGSNPVQLVDMMSAVANPAAGSRILITTPNFANYTDIPLVSDFTMIPIPATYLAAGQITFEGDVFGNYWGLNYGGAGYTGSTTGLTTNDADGNFGPPFGGPLPSTSTSALLFQGLFSAPSTNNLADYALTAGAATFMNNAGSSFTIEALEDSANFDEDLDVDGKDFLTLQDGFGATGVFSQGDANHNGVVDSDDLAIWEEQFGQPLPAVAAAVIVPEPQSIFLMCSALAFLMVRNRNSHHHCG